MKQYKMAFAFITALAVPGQAFAEWHCYAYPVDDPTHKHQAYAPTEQEAAAEAMEHCEFDHDFCNLGGCHEH